MPLVKVHFVSISVAPDYPVQKVTFRAFFQHLSVGNRGCGSELGTVNLGSMGPKGSKADALIFNLTTLFQSGSEPLYAFAGSI